MLSYRLVQHKTSAGSRFQFDSGIPSQSMLLSTDGLVIQGGISSNCGTVQGIRIAIVNQRRRELTIRDNLESSFDGTVRYYYDLSNLPELQAGVDFAIEVSAVVAGRTHPLYTLTLVRDDCKNPAVFIVGSPRSGTTIVGDSLRKTLDAEAGFGESHLLPLAGAVTRTVQEYHQSSGAAKIPGMMLHHVNPHLLGEQMLSVIKQQYSNLFADDCIVDKTPGGAMIRALPDILRLWPDARIIFAKRRGIENVVSRLKKFPDVDFESHCRQWTNCMNSWSRVKDGLTYKLEIDQFDILTQPVKSAQQLTDFLDLTPEQQKELERYLSNEKPEQSRMQPANTGSLSLESVNWSATQKTYFIDQCAENLERWGYSQDEHYYLQQRSG